VRHAWVNAALLALVPATFATGLYGLMRGDGRGAVVVGAHGVLALAILLALGAKARIVAAVVRRRGATWSLALAALLLVVLGTGLAWILTGPHAVAGLSVITWHAFAATALVVPFCVHVAVRRRRLRAPASHDRRAFLRLAGLTAGGLALYAADARFGRRRRFTGSYETGSFTGAFPETAWLVDDPAPLDAATYRLAVDGAVARPLRLSLGDLRARATAPRPVTIDCTGGWYSTQVWRGVPLAALIDEAGPHGSGGSVEVHGVTGFARRFPRDAAPELLLALDVAGGPLSHGHGSPLRLVAPGHRGYDWVKWVTAVRVLESDARLEPPLPL
jgi:DMSO/TMAO reductase YedYZ molybdopterin-dependent catalytic subunit